MGQLRRPWYTVTDPDTGKKVRRQARTWQIRYYRNGKRHEESTGYTRKSDAKLLLQDREGDIAKGLPITAQAGQLRFDDAAATVVAYYKVKKRRTVSKLEGIIKNHLEPFFGGCRMADITMDDAMAYAASRQAAGAADATINRELAILKLAFTLAIKSRKLLHRPHIEMLDESNVRSGFFERDQFETVRTHLPEAVRGIVTLAYFSGWRADSEILPLLWRQVDRKACTIRLEAGTTKNRDARTLSYDLLPELVDVIDEQWARHKELQAEGVICPFVFHRSGEEIKDFRGAWKAACKKAGCPGMLVHDLRRTAVRNLVRAGVPEKTAMLITGHKTRSVFDRYNIVTESDQREALGRLADEKGKEKGKSPQSDRVEQIR